MPQERQAHAMATLGDKIVLFGGIDLGIGRLNDTWTWDGTTWTQLSPATSPSPRSYHAMVTDGDRILMFGSQEGAPSELWQWQADNWTMLDGAGPPGTAAAVASIGGGIVVFGGRPDDPEAPTWTWRDDEGWRMAKLDGPTARHGAVMATLGGRAIMYGGFIGSDVVDETWSFEP